MELKDVVLSTLAEMEDNDTIKQDLNNAINQAPQNDFVVKPEPVIVEEEKKQEDKSSSDDELYFLTSIRERLLVLFEGFQSPNNTEIEAKVDMTLNFLEYTLATIDKRVEKIQKGNI
ncbi:MAG: hypothetical protein U9N02_05860 [Campylobacterota bacterium]|nr:hypothetical protein [Campylobacterota bacterium]